MKSKNVLKIGTGLFIIVILCLVSLKSFAHKNTKAEPTKQISKDANVIVTIDKKTTQEEFNDIKNMLKENGITATFSNIKRNDMGELTGLKIVMNDNNNNQEAASNISSSSPIAQITFGKKDGLLFISQSNTEQGAFGFFNQPNMLPFGSENDSIASQFGNFNFDDFFNNDDNNSFFFDGKPMDIDQIREQIKKQMESSGMNSNSFSWFFDSENNSQNHYSFVDKPYLNKLIIIDGKESNFENLNDLAKADKLKAVDDLKPETAKSLYGDKAKDGAIIATTK
ncbi:hypothetical protein [Confluentibacter sediminis]|uniref:hypothetical protein n=1 Tax=Confluentibacter sediminis TaxID=2219045 RepID=UPI000DAE3189|nr:hypothetical protein [Confluentibacter sediminis]